MYELIFSLRADAYPLYKGQENPQVPKIQAKFIDTLKIMICRNGPMRDTEAEAKDLEAFKDSMDDVGNIFQQGAKSQGKARASTAITLRVVPVPATPLFPPGQPMPVSSSAVM